MAMNFEAHWDHREKRMRYKGEHLSDDELINCGVSHAQLCLADERIEFKYGWLACPARERLESLGVNFDLIHLIELDVGYRYSFADMLAQLLKIQAKRQLRKQALELTIAPLTQEEAQDHVTNPSSLQAINNGEKYEST